MVQNSRVLHAFCGTPGLRAKLSALPSKRQTPKFEEYTIVLKGMLRVEFHGGAIEVRPGQAIIAHPDEWVRYSTPEPDGAEYVAICLPAFSPGTVHRDPEK